MVYDPAISFGLDFQRTAQFFLFHLPLTAPFQSGILMWEGRDSCGLWWWRRDLRVTGACVVIWSSSWYLSQETVDPGIYDVFTLTTGLGVSQHGTWKSLDTVCVLGNLQCCLRCLCLVTALYQCCTVAPPWLYGCLYSRQAVRPR